jgi:dCMP deaminase
LSKDQVWLDACNLFSTGFSRCSRRQFTAIIVDTDNQCVSIGYNGNIRGQDGDLCGGSVCLRDDLEIKSGSETDIGCIHAEENAILNCARQGISCQGTTLYINGEPCPKCANRIVQVGISRVVYSEKGYTPNGLDILQTNKVQIERFR